MYTEIKNVVRNVVGTNNKSCFGLNQIIFFLSMYLRSNVVIGTTMNTNNLNTKVEPIVVLDKDEIR